jgi:hypothetical protein
MKAAEFAYWLQGYFEINGESQSLSEAQAKQISEKASAVGPETSTVEVAAYSFVKYVEGMLFPVSQGMAGSDFLKGTTEQIKTKLHDLFVHSIDPSYEGEQDLYHAIHGSQGSGFKPNKPGSVMRC